MIEVKVADDKILTVTLDDNNVTVYARTGSFIAGESGSKDAFSFDKMLLGPGKGVMQALGKQIMRKFTKEDLPLMKTNVKSKCRLYFAVGGRYVLAQKLNKGEVLNVESDKLLAFTSDCDYSVRVLLQGSLCGNGFVTTTLTGKGDNAYVAVLAKWGTFPLICDGSKIVSCDPDTIVCWTDNDPQIHTDISWKTLIGQSSGESYTFQWSQPSKILIQPAERTSITKNSVDLTAATWDM